jgi:hypothetical protein
MARSAPWPARWSVEYGTSVGTRAATLLDGTGASRARRPAARSRARSARSPAPDSSGCWHPRAP